MELKKIEKVLKSAFNSLEENPDIRISKYKIGTTIWYAFHFFTNTKIGNEYYLKYRCHGVSPDPYRTAIRWINQMRKFLKER